MCGIAGIISKYGNQVDDKVLISMLNTISHRGPDDESIYVNGHIGLAHKRLSIIDLSENGRQPMHNEDRTIWLVINGEIYNFRELRVELLKKGHSFYSNSDSEVLIHLYEEFGENFVDKIDGMFAFAIWDEKKEQLILYRDRIGIKPLYYANIDGDFVFASEPKAVSNYPKYTPRVSFEGLHSFLSLSYIPDTNTMFEGIYKLLPGHYLKVVNNQISIRKYWDLKVHSNSNANRKDLIDEIDEKLLYTVKKHLMSDVPLGIFLSSGLDSTIIAYYASKETSQPIKSFTMGFEEEGYSEIDSAMKVSEFLSIPNYSRKIVPDVSTGLKKIIWHLDDLIPIHFPLYYLNHEVKKYFTVALSGDGGDELFGGYLTYQADVIHRITKLIPGSINKAIKKILDVTLPVSDSKLSLEYMLKRFFAGNSLSVPQAHGWWNGMFSEDEKRLLYTSSFGNQSKGINSFDVFQKYFNGIDSNDILQKMMYLDIKTILPNNYLSISDRLSMANAVEVRPPFLDHHFVEFMFNIPSKDKLGFLNLKRKSLLKELVLRKFGSRLLNKKKQGFSAPINPWLRGSLRKLIDSELNQKRIMNLGYFNPDYVERIVNRHLMYKENLGFHIWNLINFSLWHRVFIEHEDIENE